MGIFGAMTTAVAGLRAQSTSLEHISDNIANSQTIAYKRTETSFKDVVSESDPSSQKAGSVMAFTRSTNSAQGDLLGSEVDTNLAINGAGYFVIAEQAGEADGLPTFDGVARYTRRGDFELNKDGFLVNGAGYYLKGNEIDGTTGNATGTEPSVIRFSNDFLAAKPTTSINYRLNLPIHPSTASGKEFLSAELDLVGDITKADEGVFIDESIGGNSITVYDEAGNGVDVQLRWAKTSDKPDTWALYYNSNSDPELAEDVSWTRLEEDYTFGSNSKLIGPPGVVDTGDVVISNMVINGDQLGDMTLKHGSNGGLSQYNDDGGSAIVNDISQNGYSAGEMSSVSVTGDGRVSVTYTNGVVVDKWAIATASFASEGNLKKQNGSAFIATSASGKATAGASGSVVANQLEASNTDIAEEFSKLIVTQQAYAASTKILTTANEMLQEVLNMKR
ncbi:MAG: flagellar hook-basal body complex protein [Alphaproteobacteria bacterium]|nr:flagellar hook-basal body complex protein [Alphaproteobacteria bacterium]